MSAYSDWKCGALTDDEYRSYCEWEDRRDKYLYEQEMTEDDEENEQNK